MKLLRVGEFADRVGVHKGTVQRWLSKDLIPFVTLPSGERRISSDVVDDLFARAEVYKERKKQRKK
tara:strand:+ start:420 stop:617 length:198 start_codon:yes stop_codon:yes gene_type:complete